MTAMGAGSQPREADGRFSGYPHGRAESISLDAMSPIAFEFSSDPDSMSDEEYNAGGSYDYPPAPRSVEQVRAFWGSVRIPDVAMSHYQRVYREDHARYVEYRMKKWVETHNVPVDGVARAKWELDREEARKAFFAERPAEVPRSMLRTMVRVMGVLNDADQMVKEDDDRLMRTPVRLPDGSTKSAGQVWHQYGFMFESSRRAASVPTTDLQAQRMSELMAGMRSEMEDIRQDLAGRIAGTTSAVENLHESQSAVWYEEDVRAGRVKRR